MTAKIRRLAQGLMNRMSDSNLLAILGDVEKLYRNYPRYHVSSTLVTLLLTRICEPSAVLDKYLVLYGGFATAIYRLHGVDFGAALVQGVVDSFDRHYQTAVRTSSSGPSTKEALNVLGFISQLYSFQLIGANLVFDYIRLLLGELSELNAELLLRVVRTSGSSLRQDDPLALKDIVTLIRPAVAQVGEKNMSVRTRFMIETINDLKNNKIKAGTTSAKHADHVTQMKKLLGSLRSRKLKSTEPLRIGLRDIRESDKKGKWWLVGASWAGKTQDGAGERNDEEDGDSHVVLTGEDADLPDLWKLAREQNMNTGTQQAIFVALLSAADYEDACAKIHKLRLNKDRRGEISTVLLQCVGAEEHYNPYYTLAAGKLCSADRKVKYSFQDSLWKFFRRLGQPLFDDETDEADEDETVDMRRIVNVAKMFGSLVARGVLGLSILRCLDMTYLQTKPKMFVEVMLVSCLLELGEGAVARAFGAETQELARGLRWFLRTVVRKTDLVDRRERKALRSTCKSAEKALQDALLAESGHVSDED